MKSNNDDIFLDSDSDIEEITVKKVKSKKDKSVKINSKTKVNSKIIEDSDDLFEDSDNENSKVIPKVIPKVVPKQKSKVIPKPNKAIDSNEIRKVFKKYFPGKEIKPIQFDIISSLLSGEDTIAILPTGYGKSVCYQMPYLLNQDKIVIVISPLISLMEDQKDKLDKMGVSSFCFHSNIKQKKKKEVQVSTLENLDVSSNGMILFLTPEYIANCESWIKQLAINDKLSLVAFDEAHCISTWGHDFRPDYQTLAIKDWVSEYNIPILALTATATKQVEADIIKHLNLDNPKKYTTSFDRPNLMIKINSKPKEYDVLLPILEKYKNDFTIIYCKTRDKTDLISQYLKDNNYNADIYHAGMSSDNRQKIQDKFANRQLNIIVATIAFGMGIDQNVHLVIHWGCPSDMESYYQEIGRAGRDGVESECYLYYNNDDFRISRYFIKDIQNPVYKRYKNEQISKMEQFCYNIKCRRKSILKHFGEELPDHYKCNKCDNCIKQDNISKEASTNLLYPIFIIIKTVINVRSNLGTNKICLLLKGSKSKLITNFIKINTYGLLNDLTDDQIKSIINLLVINDYLKTKCLKTGVGQVIDTTVKVMSWYSKINLASKDKELTFDNLEPIIKKNNNLTLNIPIEYNNISDIKFKNTLNDLMSSFSDLL